MDLLYRKVSQLFSRRKKKPVTKTCDKKHNLLTDGDQIQQRWKEHIDDIYDNKGKLKEDEVEVLLESDVPEDYKGRELLYSDLRKHCQSQKWEI